jgi:predicted aldo/keto reductase-like oxidoreductase
MAASILNSQRAVQASIYVVRAFVKLRQMLATHKELAAKVEQLEHKLQTHDKQIKDIIAAIRHVLQDERIDILNIGMRLKEEIDANIKILSGSAAYTSEDRALLAEFSAKLYDTDAIKRLKVE